MSAIVLDPHGDDCALFCAFAALSTQPTIVIGVLRSQVQQDRYGITAATREAESEAAMIELGFGWEQWTYLDSDPPWTLIRASFELLAEQEPDSVSVFAPAVEEDGHEHHNRIGELAQEVFGDRVISYLTYTRSGGRSRDGTEVEPKPEWIERKHRALACYRSQIEEPSCREHFLNDLREYVSP